AGDLAAEDRGVQARLGDDGHLLLAGGGTHWARTPVLAIEASGHVGCHPVAEDAGHVSGDEPRLAVNCDGPDGLAGGGGLVDGEGAHAAASIPSTRGPAGGRGSPGPAGGLGCGGGGLGRGLAATMSCRVRPTASASSAARARVMSMTPRRHRDSDDGVVLRRWARSASLVAPRSAHRASMASKSSQTGRVGMTLTQSTLGMR